MIAITRDVAPTVSQCELTHLARVPIDYAAAAAEQREYRAALASLGLEVVCIPGDPAFPDCVFIEDTAVVLDDVAVITRPGAASRRGETRAVAERLAKYRPLVHIEAPATLDGGDVLVLDDTIYVGLSERTNEAGIEQLRALTRRNVAPVRVDGALHLKTAVTRVSHDSLLVNREWIDVSLFDGWTLVDVDPAEAFGANALLVGDRLIFPKEYPRTRMLLEKRGIDVLPVFAGELAKAEGGVTCCSLILR